MGHPGIRHPAGAHTGGRAGTGIDVYVREGIATRAALLWDQGDGHALPMEVLTPWGKHVHSPQCRMGLGMYVQWWADPVIGCPVATAYPSGAQGSLGGGGGAACGAPRKENRRMWAVLPPWPTVVTNPIPQEKGMHIRLPAQNTASHEEWCSHVPYQAPSRENNSGPLR